MADNLLVVHGGGPTAVINASLYGVIREAKKNPSIGKVLGAIGGTGAIFTEQFLDLTAFSDEKLKLLLHTPASAIGSSRYPLYEEDYAKMPEIESARAVLITESYKQTENEPMIIRRAKAFQHILENIPITIRDQELVVGSSTLAPRGCQTFPEFSYEWLEAEFDTVETRSADPFYISEQTKKELKEANAYWKGRTTSDLATAYMEPETLLDIEHNIFTPGNYFYNGVGHVTVKYEEVLAIGYEGIIAKAQKELDESNVGDGDYAKNSRFLEAVIMS